MLARALKLDSTMADAWYNVGALYDMCDQPEVRNCGALYVALRWLLVLFHAAIVQIVCANLFH